MSKTIKMLALVPCLVLGLVISNLRAATAAGNSGFMVFNSRDLIGSIVKDSCGKEIGVVDRIMVDSGGRAFAVVNHGDYDLTGSEGIDTPVPFEAMRIYPAKTGLDTITLKTDMEHLDLAPYLDPLKKYTTQDETHIYEYYGIQPSWTGRSTGTNGFAEFNSLSLIGTSVQNPNGAYIGTVNEVMVDSAGHAFAVVNHGDYNLYDESAVNSPVPLEALQFSQTKSGSVRIVLDMSNDRLYQAPYLSPFKTFNRRSEAKIYQYYGIQPYWTQSTPSK
jgi:ribosomal 30S subunit maturation factor RimM